MSKLASLQVRRASWGVCVCVCVALSFSLTYMWRTTAWRLCVCVCELTVQFLLSCVRLSVPVFFPDDIFASVCNSHRLFLLELQFCASWRSCQCPRVICLNWNRLMSPTVFERCDQLTWSQPKCILEPSFKETPSQESENSVTSMFCLKTIVSKS